MAEHPYKKVLFALLCVVIVLFTVYHAAAIPFTPGGNIDLKHVYSLVNGVNVNATTLYGNLSWDYIYGEPSFGNGTITEVVAGSGLTGGGTSGSVTLDVGAGTGITVNANSVTYNSSVIQTRVDSSCTAGNAIRVIASDGSVTCEPTTAGNTTAEMRTAVNNSGYYNITVNDSYWLNGQAASYYYAASNPSGYITITQAAAGLGNWSGNQSLYATIANLQSVGNYSSENNTIPHNNSGYWNFTVNNSYWLNGQPASYYYAASNPTGYITIVQADAGLGNWSGNQSLYTLSMNLVSALGNWSADKSGYATTGNLASVGNWSGNQSLYTLSASLVTALGNWSADKANYATTANLASVGNWTNEKSGYATLVTLGSIGNWTGNISSYTTSANLVAALGNWSLDKSGYATLTNLASIGNWTGNVSLYTTSANLVTALGNWSADKASYTLLTTFGSIGNWTGNITLYTPSANLVAALGNWSADKSGYATTISLASVGNWSGNASLYTMSASLVTALGNWTADKASYALNTFVQSGGNYTQARLGWEACADGNYSRWNGTNFTCYNDEQGGGTANFTYSDYFDQALNTSSDVQHHAGTFSSLNNSDGADPSNYAYIFDSYENVLNISSPVISTQPVYVYGTFNGIDMNNSQLTELYPRSVLVEEFDSSGTATFAQMAVDGQDYPYIILQNTTGSQVFSVNPEGFIYGAGGYTWDTDFGNDIPFRVSEDATGAKLEFELDGPDYPVLRLSNSTGEFLKINPEDFTYNGGNVCTDANGLCPGGGNTTAEVQAAINGTGLYNISVTGLLSTANITVNNLSATGNISVGQYIILGGGIIGGGSTGSGGGWTNDTANTNTSLNVNIDNNASITGNVSVGEYLILGGGLIGAAISFTDIASNITPAVNDTYTFGTPAMVWKALYVGNSSLHIGNIILNEVNGTLNIGEDSLCTAQNGLCPGGGNTTAETRTAVNNSGYYNITASATTASWTNVTTTNTTVGGSTLGNISGLQWTAAANGAYTFDCILFYNSSFATNGLSLAIEDYGATVDRLRMAVIIYGVSATTQNSGTVTAVATKITSTAVAAINTIYSAELHGYVNAGGTAVTIAPQFSSELGANNRTTIIQESYCNVQQR